ncbi:MAG TPA: hypothetical protein VM639_24235 [Dongiaceae bacterium]|nr:hypothetical protein [Dongiaceae bacterium]
MSAAKIPSIRDRMRQQEILALELGGPAVECTASSKTTADVRRLKYSSGERKPARAKVVYQGDVYQADNALDRPVRAATPGFAGLIRKVIAH